MRRRGFAGWVAAGLAVLAAAGCGGGSQPHLQTAPPATTSTPSATTTSTIDPNAQPAFDAYSAFFAASLQAQRDPQKFVAGKDPTSDIAPYSFDPIRGLYVNYIKALTGQKAAFRGTPPAPRVRVKAVELNAKPYPRVMLLDCPTPAPDWQEYVLATGKVVPQANGKVPPPYLLTVEVIYYQGRWGVSRIGGDKSRTCTA